MSILKSILYTILFYLVLEFFGFWIFLIPRDQSFEVLPYLDLINSLVQLFVVIIYLRYIKRTELFKIEKTKIHFYIIAILLGFMFVFFQSILNIFYFFNLSINLLPNGIDFSELMSFHVFTTILIIPITEEIFFRNYIQRDLQKNINHKKAILITSILFSFIHIPFGAFFVDSLEFSVHQAYIAFFGGLILGQLFYKSKSIGPPLVFHMTWNLIANISI